MDRFLCQLCNTTVKYGESHSCFCYQNRDELYSVQVLKDGIYKEECGRSNKPPTLSRRPVKSLLTKTRFLRCSGIKRAILKLNHSEKDYTPSEASKLYTDSHESSLANHDTCLSETVEDSEIDVRVPAERCFETLKFEETLTDGIANPASHMNRLSNISASKNVDESESLISSAESLVSPNLSDTAAGPSGLQNSFSGTVESKFLMCQTCGAGFSNKQDFDSHCLKHNVKKHFVCDVCNEMFSRKVTFDTHYRTHTGQNLYVCDVCDKSFACQSALKTHYRSHTGEKPFACDSCGKAFSRKSTLDKHYLMHTGEKQFVCDSCGKAFAHKMNLDRHYLTHTAERPFVCEICRRGFIRSDKLRNHLLLHTKDESFKCRECGKTFASQGGLDRHYKSNHSGILSL